MAFDEVCMELGRLIEQWSRPGTFVVPDTSVYIKHPDKLEEMDLAAMTEVRGEDIHILVPVIVAEELDGLKQRGDDHGRWRAGYSLAVLDRVLSHLPKSGTLRGVDHSAAQDHDVQGGQISMECCSTRHGTFVYLPSERGPEPGTKRGISARRKDRAAAHDQTADGGSP